MYSRTRFISGGVGLLVVCFGSALIHFATAGHARAQPAESPQELSARIDRLIQKLGDDSSDIRDEVKTALIKIGPPAATKLFEATRDSDPTRSHAAVEAFRIVAWAKSGLKFVSQIKRHELQGAVTIVLSPDGRFVYVPAHTSAAVNVFRRDAVTGRLTHQQTVKDEKQLDGVVTLRLSSDGKYAVAAACSAKSITLYSRDETTGELTLLSIQQSADDSDLKTLQWPTEAIFSKDDKFIYAIDDQTGSVLAFEVSGGSELNLVESFEGPDRCFHGARGITAHPDGKTLFVSSSRAGTLTVLDRDPKTGKVGVRQILRDEEDGIHGLGGAVEMCISRDGKSVYTISGRFGGDNAIGVFRFGADGRLSILQEFINEKTELKEFVGGAKGLVISPDGKRFYAAGTTSHSLACFDRDAVSGKLTYVTTLKNLITGKNEGVASSLGANGIDVSADGKYVYLALEDAGAVSVLERTMPPPDVVSDPQKQ